jgi:hypothetical protein
MARTTKQLSGGGKDKFLRALISTEPAVDTATALRLGDTMCAAIADVRVRREAWEEKRGEPRRAEGKSKPAASPKPDAAAAAPTPAFDPFAFSALAVLTKKGPQELAKQLAAIASPADLHALAVAQHLTVNAALTDVATLRAAIVTATEQRLAERRAAAS